MDNRGAFSLLGTKPAIAERPSGFGASSTTVEPAIAKALYRLRRRRERLFSFQLSSEPAWDLLLDLLEAERVGKNVSVKSACLASGAPTTTALRWLKHLESQGVVCRESDPADGRRMYIRLSEDTRNQLHDLLGDLGHELGKIVTIINSGR